MNRSITLILFLALFVLGFVPVNTLFVFLGQNEYRLSNADNRLIRSSHRYYVYALRHILI